MKKYFILSILAGAFIALGRAAAMAVGGMTGSKLLASVVFASALSLCVMAGSALFTGECLKQSPETMKASQPISRGMKSQGICWLGNMVGSWAVLAAYLITGVAPAVLKYTIGVSVAKAAETPAHCLFLAILCNICVCAAVWRCIKMQSEAGKLIMIFWCLLIFMVYGYEHSVANMSIIGLAVLNGAVPAHSYLGNLALVTIGNAIGGICCIAWSYYTATIKAG